MLPAPMAVPRRADDMPTDRPTLSSGHASSHPSTSVVSCPLTPSLTPTVFVAEPELARQGTMMSGGSGGQAGSPYPLPDFPLETMLPDGPSRMALCERIPPDPLTPLIASESAQHLGLDGDVYVPRWMTFHSSNEDVSHMSNAVIDEPRSVLFDGTDQLHYWDCGRMSTHAGHWNPPGSVQPLDQAVDTATAFLEGGRSSTRRLPGHGKW